MSLTLHHNFKIFSFALYHCNSALYMLIHKSFLCVTSFYLVSLCDIFCCPFFKDITHTLKAKVICTIWMIRIISKFLCSCAVQGPAHAPELCRAKKIPYSFSA